MLYCPNCGTSNQGGSKFCDSCGEPLPPPSGQKCSQCGHLNPPGVFSCVRCRASLLASLLASFLDEGLPPPGPSEEPEWLQALEETPWAPEEVLEGVEEEPEWLRELGASADETRVTAEEEVLGQEAAAPWEALEGLVEEVPLEPQEKDGLLVGIRGALRAEPIFAAPHRAGEAAPSPLAGTDQAARFEDVVSQPLAPGAAKERARARTGVPRWPLYLILAGVVAAGILLRGESIRLPFTPATADFHKTIESLEEGSVVLLSHDYDPGTAAEITPQARAILSHLLRRGAKMVNLSLIPEGQALADRALESVVGDHEGYVQGRDYINLGFVAGNEVGARFIAESLGTRLSLYPLGEEVGGLEDVDLIIVLAGSQEHLRRWVEQVQAPYKVVVVAGVSAQVDPVARPYYRSGQLKGLLSGLVGAAEYERVIQRPGAALSAMLPQAAAHLVIALFILLGNFAYLLERLKG